MPEGNEIHRFAKLHTATFVGKTICVESPNGRFTGVALLTGRKLKSVIAHGKHLAYDFGRDDRKRTTEKGLEWTGTYVASLGIARAMHQPIQARPSSEKSNAAPHDKLP